jgi:hypothetical protein
MASIMTGVIGFATLFAFASGCHSAETERALQRAVSPAASGDNRTANLQLVLEGPLAMCAAPNGKADKMVILVPKVRHHFEPGFSADTNETPLCEGDYILDFDKDDHKNRPAKYEGTIWDKVGADCLQKAPGYLSLVVDKPDRILPMQFTTAAITNAAGAKSDVPNGREDYASQTLFYYNNVLLSGISVKRYKTGTNGTNTTKVTSDKCRITTKLPGGVKVKTDLPFSSWQPEFYNLGSDVRLTFGMIPSEMDDITHSHATRAYAGIARMLGVDRVVRFPKLTEAGLTPHNDCRAPQMLVLPLEARH